MSRVTPTGMASIRIASLQHIYTANMPEVHEVIRAMRGLLDEYERPHDGGRDLPAQSRSWCTYYGAKQDECHLPFNFQLINAAWNAQADAPAWWTSTRRRCRPPAGPTGCSATTTSTAWPPVSGQTRRASPTCSCSPCAARPPATTATSWAWRMCRSRRSWYKTRRQSTSLNRPHRGPRPGTHAHAVGRCAQRRLCARRRPDLAAPCG